MATPDAIVTQGLTKTYGLQRMPVPPPIARMRAVRAPVLALRDLTVSVKEGEVFGFLGPNGAGKSTMIRILLGFLHATSGTATVLGRDVLRDSVEIRRHVGYLPGGISLYDSMSGEALLDYLANLYGQPTPLRTQLVERLEFSAEDLRRPIRDYSRGMRQKIGIIQAFQHDPQLAVLDEPTEGLDPLMQRAFYDVLLERRAAGRTIFFSSHILSEVERVCDQVAIIRKGQLVALSNVETLLARRKRHVEIRLEGERPKLEGVAGVSDVRVRDDSLVTCQLEGDIGPFLAALEGTRIHDLLIEPARLEEAFLEYYAQDDRIAPT